MQLRRSCRCLRRRAHPNSVAAAAESLVWRRVVARSAGVDTLVSRAFRVTTQNNMHQLGKQRPPGGESSRQFIEFNNQIRALIIAC